MKRKSEKSDVLSVNEGHEKGNHSHQAVGEARNMEVTGVGFFSSSNVAPSGVGVFDPAIA